MYQQDRIALFFGQGPHCSPDIGDMQRILLITLAEIIGQKRRRRHQTAPPCTGTLLVAHRIERHAIKPALERSAAVKAADRRAKPHADGLRHILSIGAIAGPAAGDAEDKSVMARQKQLESTGITGPRPFDQGIGSGYRVRSRRSCIHTGSKCPGPALADPCFASLDLNGPVACGLALGQRPLAVTHHSTLRNRIRRENSTIFRPNATGSRRGSPRLCPCRKGKRHGHWRLRVRVAAPACESPAVRAKTPVTRRILGRAGHKSVRMDRPVWLIASRPARP